jgi:hypothetical protein
MNLITDAEFEAILSAIGAIDDYDQSVELMKMTVELGVHRASRVVSGNLGLRLSFPENPDSTLQRTGEQVFTSFSPDEPVRPSSDPQHAGDSGLDAVSTDDPAPISSTTPHAGDSEVRSPSADDPAPILSSSPIKKGESEGGSSALHLPADAPPMPDPSHKWKAQYTPEQLDSILKLAIKSPRRCSNYGIAKYLGLPPFTVRDARLSHGKRIEWLRAQSDEGVRNQYLSEMLALNNYRARLTQPKHAGESGSCPLPPEEPAPTLPAPQAGGSDVSSLSTDEPAQISTPTKVPPRTSLRDFNEDEFNASAFGPPPVPRSPGATARRIALTADLILNKANTEQNK